MKKIIILALLVFNLAGFTNGLSAQVSYSFTKIPPGVIVYQDLSGDTPITSYTWPGLYSIPGISGESYPVYCKQMTMNYPTGWAFIGFGENGFMRLDDDTSSVIVDGVFTTLDSIDPTSKRSYKLEGSVGARIFKFQYKNLKINGGAAGNYVNFQIWYYETTGVIEIKYGGRSATNGPGAYTSNGPHAGIFYSPGDFSVCWEKIWCEVNPNNPTLDSAANFSFNAMTGVPDSGTVFRFTPKCSVTTNIPGNKTTGSTSMFYSNETNELVIKCEDPLEEIVVYDIEGTVVHRSRLEKGKHHLDLRHLPAGIYNVRRSGTKGSSSSLKIAKFETD